MHVHTHTWARYMHAELLKMASFLMLISEKNLKEII